MGNQARHPLRSSSLVVGLVAALIGANAAEAQAVRDYISIVGSSTVYPFATVVAEQFGRKTSFKTPKVESTGSGGGLKLFCGGVGVEHPDIANSSRRITPSELATCAQNGVDQIVEVEIGFDGIVLDHTEPQDRCVLYLLEKHVKFVTFRLTGFVTPSIVSSPPS